MRRILSTIEEYCKYHISPSQSRLFLITPYIGPIIAVVTIIVFMISSFAHSTQPPNAFSSDFTSIFFPPSVLLSSLLDGVGEGAGWRSAHPSLFDIAGRHIILYTSFLGRPDFSIKSSTLLVDCGSDNTNNMQA